MLSPFQRAKFEEDGLLVIPEFFSLAEAANLKKHADELLKKLDLSGHPMTRFSTGTNNGQHVGDEYFLNSGNKIRYFFEEGSFNDKGELIKPKECAINKIGHGLHLLDPQFKDFSLRPEVIQILKTLGFVQPVILQSMLIFKQPEIGGEVPPHQDSTFIYTDPPSAIGFWFALEDCTVENGCLKFIAGSHKTHPITKRFVRSNEGTGTTFISLDKQGSETAGVDTAQSSTVSSQFVDAPVKAGSLVLIHGSVVHASGPNHSQKSRYIYTFHAIEKTARYDEKNWLQISEKDFSPVYC